MRKRPVAVLLLLFASLVHGSAPSVSEIIAANKAASGGDAWDQVQSLKANGNIQLGDLSGSISTLVDMEGMRFRSDAEVGPLTQVQVVDREQVLARDSGGQVNRIEAPGDVRSSLSDLYRSVNALWYPDRWTARVERLPDTEEGEQRFHRLSVAPEAAQPFEIWIDTESHLFDRIIEQSGHSVVTTRYSDYRSTEGLRFARHIEIAVEGGQNTQVLQIETVQVNPPIEDGAFVLEDRAADDFRITDGADTVVIPFELYNNHTYLKAWINGEGPFQFLADTGGRHLLTPQVAEAVGIETQGEFDIGGAGAKRRTASLASVGKLKVGTLELVDQPFIVLDMSELSSVGGERIDGLIGYEVFRRFIVEYDYANREIRLHRPESFDYQGDGYVVPFRFSHTTPLIRGTIDGQEGDITIDTGSRSHLSLTTPFAEAHDYETRYPDAPETIIGWGVGGPNVGKVVRGRELQIGDELVVEAPLIDFTDQAAGALSNPDEIANLGAGILRQFTLILDYGAKQIIFEPNERFGTREPHDRAGMFLREVESGFEVVHVTPRSPAAEAGIGIGDVIVRIDDTAATDMSLPGLREHWRNEAPGTTFNLVLADGEDLRLTLSELVP